ncbi:MAG: hypothetical protein Q7J32_02110, partial [Sphingomonadaceae bacterium]|nr:hypothetical protein [Sphingomonadaceae bacterium]
APAPAAAQVPTAALPAEICAADGGRALCGYRQPEDMVRVPGTPWLLVSQTATNGGLTAIDVRDKSSRRLFPAPGAKIAFDRKRYAGCPGPPPAGDEFTVAGLAVRAGPVATIYGVGLRKRRAIEVFEMDTRAATPAVTWVGCAPTPAGLGLNSVAPLPDGGFVTSKFLRWGGDMAAEVERARAGEINGELWSWAPGAGWAKVPGTESAGANGVVTSADGRWLYLVGWGSRSFSKISVGRTPVERRDIQLGFRLDNIHWAADGSILGAGQAGTDAAPTTKVVRIDPETLAVTDLVEAADTPAFGMGSAAVEVGDEIWVGSPRRDRIAIFAAPAAPATR